MMQETALAGVRVLDFGHVWSGPYCAHLLADLGAEVIKVESRQRVDVHRRQGPYPNNRPDIDRSGVWNAQNRGKLSCTINLATTKGTELMHALVKRSDVVVQNLSPRAARKLGLDYASLVGVRPDIIVASLSGFGSTGPERDFVAYGNTLEAAAGLSAITGFPDQPPQLLGEVIPDVAGGVAGAFAILLALYHRDLTGQGQEIDQSQLETMAALLPEPLLEYSLTHRVMGPSGNRDEIMAPHGVYRCRGDDRWIAIAVDSEAAWMALCRAAGHAEWLADERFADGFKRRQHLDEVDALIEAWTGQLEADEVMARLQTAGVAAALSMTTKDLAESDHLRQREAFVDIDHPAMGRHRVYAPTWRLSATPARIARPAPTLAEHNDYVFGKLLGLAAAEIEELIAEQVIF